MQDGPTPQMALGDYLPWWLEEVIRPRVRRRTYEHYAYLVRSHIAPALGCYTVGTGPSGLSVLRVEAWLTERVRSGLSGQTARLARSCLRRAYNDAIRYDLTESNPAKESMPPKVREFVPMPLTPEEARILLASLRAPKPKVRGHAARPRGDRLAALYTVAIALGLREGEIAGLRWSDVDLDREVLKVRWQLQVINRSFVFEEPKGRKRQREIHMPAVVAQELREHRILQEQERLAAGAAWVGDEWDLVFCRPNGLPYRGEGLYKHFQRCLKVAGLRPRRFHDLRHSCASLLVSMEVPLEEVQEILGHADLAFTSKTYKHLYGAAGLRASVRMSEFLGGAGTEAGG